MRILSGGLSSVIVCRSRIPNWLDIGTSTEKTYAPMVYVQIGSIAMKTPPMSAAFRSVNKVLASKTTLKPAMVRHVVQTQARSMAMSMQSAPQPLAWTAFAMTSSLCTWAPNAV